MQTFQCDGCAKKMHTPDPENPHSHAITLMSMTKKKNTHHVLEHYCGICATIMLESVKQQSVGAAWKNQPVQQTN